MYSDLFGFNDMFNVVLKSFNRPLKEINGYKVIEKDFGLCVIVNALGVDKDDLKVEVVKNILKIYGKTEVKEIDFTNSINLSLDINKIKSQLENIEYEFKSGLVYINLYLKQEEQKEIKIICK